MEKQLVAMEDQTTKIEEVASGLRAVSKQIGELRNGLHEIALKMR